LEGAPGTNLPTSRPFLRQSKIKSRPLVDFPLSPDPATMALDDALDDGQADPAAFVFIIAVQALKNLVQFVGILFIKPRTVVFNVILDYSA